jgi:hypothetical protein
VLPIPFPALEDCISPLLVSCHFAAARRIDGDRVANQSRRRMDVLLRDKEEVGRAINRQEEIERQRKGRPKRRNIRIQLQLLLKLRISATGKVSPWLINETLAASLSSK